MSAPSLWNPRALFIAFATLVFLGSVFEVQAQHAEPSAPRQASSRAGSRRPMGTKRETPQREPGAPSPQPLGCGFHGHTKSRHFGGSCDGFRSARARDSSRVSPSKRDSVENRVRLIALFAGAFALRWLWPTIPSSTNTIMDSTTCDPFSKVLGKRPDSPRRTLF